jgi:ADP-ribose pyrophosphatase
MIFEEKTVSTKRIYDGIVVNLRVDTVELPDGKTALRDIVEHPGGVGIVAITDDNKILMVKQYRKPIEKAIIELPAGKLDKDEDHEVCGRRELEEETGFKAKEFTYLGYMYPSPGFDDEVTHLYLARDLYKGEVNLDEDEYLDVYKYDISEVKEMIMNNEINDAKTVIGFFKAMEYLK